MICRYCNSSNVDTKEFSSPPVPLKNLHGGSRPVTRPDDGRIQTKPGYERITKLRYLAEAEEAELAEARLTPRQRAEILLAWVRRNNEQ